MFYYLTVAPSQHDGFSMPDINFMKNVNGATETITFQKFAQGDTPVLTGDITPEFYINHVSTSQSGETFKVYQFPISLHLQTLALTDFSISIQAMSTGNAPLQLYLFQFTGTGQTSPAPIPIGNPIVTTPTWSKYDAEFSFPSDSGLSSSTSGDD